MYIRACAVSRPKAKRIRGKLTRWRRVSMFDTGGQPFSLAKPGMEGVIIKSLLLLGFLCLSSAAQAHHLFEGLWANAEVNCEDRDHDGFLEVKRQEINGYEQQCLITKADRTGPSTWPSSGSGLT